MHCFKKLLHLADDHMKQFFKTMHLANRVQATNFKGKNPATGEEHDISGEDLVKLHAARPQPWEYSKYKQADGWGRSTSRRTLGNKPATGFDFLRDTAHKAHADQLKAHADHPDHAGVDFTGAYPIENIKLNGKYVAVDKVDPADEYVPHEFDSHPVMKTHTKKAEAYSDEEHAGFTKALEDWHEGIHNEGSAPHKYLTWRSKMGTDAYEKRGESKADSVHAPVKEPLDLDKLNEPATLAANQALKDTTKKRRAAKLRGSAKADKPAVSPEQAKHADINETIDAHTVEKDGTKTVNKDMAGTLLRAGVNAGHYSHDDIVNAGHDPKDYGIEPPKTGGS